MDVLTRYRESVPKAGQWSDKQKESQLHDATVYEKHVRDLASCDIKHEQTLERHTSGPVQSIIALARNYAGTTEKSWECIKNIEKRRRSILKGTWWMHKTILALVECGWSIARATELFLLGMTLEQFYLD